MTTHRLNILLAILGTIAGILILALIHAGASPQPTAARHWIAVPFLKNFKRTPPAASCGVLN